MTTAVAPPVEADIVVHLPIDLVHPDPSNPRPTLTQIEDMAASIKRWGIQDPITVRQVTIRDDGGNEVEGYMVCRGHRRLAGAKSAGQSTVRAFIVTAEQAERERLARRMVENLQRVDLSAVEEAQGIQQILDLGVSADDTASDLGVTVEHVTAANRVATSKGMPKVAAKVADLTLEEAAALAEFENEPKVFKDLAETLERWPANFAHRVAQYRRAREGRAAEEAATEEWKAKGYRILTWEAAQKAPVVPLFSVKPTKGNARQMSVEHHAECPGRAVVISHAQGNKVEVGHYCADPEKQGHELSMERSANGELKTPEPPKSERQVAKEQTERRQHRAGINASKAAQVVRREFVTAMVAAKMHPKGCEAFIADQLTQELNGMESRVAPVFGELVGIEAGNNHGDNVKVQQAYLDKRRGKPLMVLLARVCAEQEHAWEPNTWAHTEAKDPRRAQYLRFLTLNGYTPSVVERIILGSAKAHDVVREQDAVKARARLTKRTGSSEDAPKRGEPRTEINRAPARKAPRKPAKRRAPGSRPSASMTLLRYRPIKVWPDGWRPNDNPEWCKSPFSAPWSKTLEVLDRELYHLGADEATVQLDTNERNCRADGSLRGDAVVSYRGVILTVDSTEHGTLTYPCNKFTNAGREAWRQNLRAIGLGLESLRRVERYGIANRGQQYAGYAELPSGIALGQHVMTLYEASVILAEAVSDELPGINGGDLMADPTTPIEEAVERVWRIAAKKHHPDNAGDPAVFDQITKARDLLATKGGW